MKRRARLACQLPSSPGFPGDPRLGFFSETKTWMAGRHCERKRSKNLINGKMDCFVAKAPRNDASLKIHTRRWKNAAYPLGGFNACEISLNTASASQAAVCAASAG